MKHGDFSSLANDYSKYRPGYSESVATMLLALTGKPINEIDFADVGAGTGLWTRLVANKGVRKVVAVEPNSEMRAAGARDTAAREIEWLAGSGEETGLPDKTFDLVTMASSFHWVDFDKGTREFARILRPGGRFAALWNPRLVEANPFTKRIEGFLYELVPNLKRISSGKSDFTDSLTENLTNNPWFDDVVYMEGRHVMRQEPEAYLGVWRSVNDIRVQAGEEKFGKFLSFIGDELKRVEYVEAHYRTCAWCARAL